MKKIIATFLAVLMLFSVVSAAGAGASGGGATAAPTVEIPSATVTGIDTEALFEAEGIDLSFALNFKADEATDDQLAAYGDWYADFVLTVNKTTTFNSDGSANGYLAGQYDAWSENWVKVPPSADLTVEANEPLKIMETAAELMGQPGLKYTYKEVYETVQDFDCGVYFTPEFIAANPDLSASLELRIYNPEDETVSYDTGSLNEVFFTAFPDATVTDIDTDALFEAEGIDLTYALNFKADVVTDTQLAVYKNWYADFVLEVNKDVTFNSDGSADGYLAGQYDAWSENWVKVPPSADLTVEANEPLRIMATAAELMGQPGLQYTYGEVYETVQDFDCGVYFTPEFIEANPDLEVTLSLRIYKPVDDDDYGYPIGEEYVFTVTPSTPEDNVVIQGTQSSSNSVTIQDINTTGATQGTTNVTIDTNDFIDTSANDIAVDTISLPVTAVEAVDNLGDDATLNITLANDAGDIEVSINKDALGAITAAANAESAQSVIFKVEEAEASDLTANQNSTTVGLDNAIVYTVSFETEDGTPVYAPAAGATNREIEIKIPYTPSSSNATVHVKFLKDDGTLEEIDASYSNGYITMKLAHFSDYIIYEEVTSSGGSVGGGFSGGLASSAPAEYTVTFDSNGGSAVASQTVIRNKKLNRPTSPTKIGYTFGGWYVDKALTNAYNFEVAVTEDFTLYAKWTAVAADDKTEDTPVASTWFDDVASSAWFYNDVKYVNDNKLMNGTSATKFAPNALLTRAMLVTILYRNEGEPAVSGDAFADVKADAWYANAVKWAKENAIVNGVSNTAFAPDANITREQIAAIMFRYATYKAANTSAAEGKLSAFADADKVSSYAKEAFNWAVDTGLINGKGANTLAPKDNATRAEIAAILHRYLTK